MIRWCLYLRHLSGRAYDMMRESGVVNLPSQRTLRDYTYHTHASTGFSAAVDQQLVAAAGLGTCPDRERSIVILMDEMHIREDIVYDPVSGKPYNYTTEHANLLIHFIQTFQVQWLGLLILRFPRFPRSAALRRARRARRTSRSDVISGTTRMRAMSFPIPTLWFHQASFA